MCYVEECIAVQAQSLLDRSYLVTLSLNLNLLPAGLFYSDKGTIILLEILRDVRHLGTASNTWEKTEADWERAFSCPFVSS